MKAEEILDVLSKKHNPEESAFFEELRIGTGYGKDSEQRFDGWAIHYHPSKRNVVTCYEIKVSKSDFKSEINKPIKRRAGLRLSNEFYFVMPKGLVPVEEIPPECGLMEYENGNLSITIKAPYRDSIPSWMFVSAIARRKDTVRKGLWMALKGEDGLLQSYAYASINVIKKHIEKWKNYKVGNKEVPDMFAKELETILDDVNESVKENKRL